MIDIATLLFLLTNFNQSFIFHQVAFNYSNADYSSLHCAKSVRIRNYSGPYFPACRLNMDQNNSEYEDFLRTVKLSNKVCCMRSSCNKDIIRFICENNRWCLILICVKSYPKNNQFVTTVYEESNASYVYANFESLIPETYKRFNNISEGNILNII